MAVTNKRQAPYPATSKDGVIIGTSRLRKTYVGVVPVAGTYAATAKTTSELLNTDGEKIVLGLGEYIKGVTLYAPTAVSVSTSSSGLGLSLGHTTATTTEYMALTQITGTANLTASPSLLELTATASYATPYAVTGSNTVYYARSISAAATVTGGPVYVIIETVDLFGGKRGSEAAATAANTVPV